MGERGGYAREGGSRRVEGSGNLHLSHPTTSSYWRYALKEEEKEDIEKNRPHP